TAPPVPCRAEREEQAFHQQLSNQSPPVGPERRANRKFLFACHGSRQQQVCHVSASDQEQQTHGCKHGENRRAELAHDAISERLHLQTEMFRIILRISQRQTLRYQSQIRLRHLL